MRSLIVCLVLLCPMSVHAANVFLEGGIGLSQFLKTTDDGVWIQDRMPHTTDWQSLAMRGGVGLKLTPSWSLGINYLRLGSVNLTSIWQSDEVYQSQCGLSGGSYHGTLAGAMQGGELIATYHPQLWHVSPLVRAGIAGFDHTVQWQTSNQPGVNQFRGIVLSGVLGAGACYHEWLCGDVSYYRGFADTAYPVSTGAVVSMFSLKYHF